MEGKTPEKEFEQKTIRTYESDIAEAIQHRQTSQVSIVMAENDRKIEAENASSGNTTAEKTSGTLGKNILKILISLIFIAGGIIGGYYLYSISPLAVAVPTTSQPTTRLVPYIIAPDSQKTVDVGGKTADQIIEIIRAQAAPSSSAFSKNYITEFVLYKKNTTDNTNEKITGQEFLSGVGLNPPDILTRSLTDSWMLGVYGNAQNKPFIILTTNFFQNAFSGMLQWEPTMPDDLTKVLGFTVQQNTLMQRIATSSATSTPVSTSTTRVVPSSSFFGIRGTFSDKVIENKDAREFTDQSGTTLFLYAFLDNATLVIARDEATLGEIITRFEKRAYVR